MGGDEHVLSLYADDTQILLDGTEESLRATLSVLGDFYRMSGLDWVTGNLNILGINFTASLYNICELNYSEKIKQMKSLFRTWGKRKLTLLGRIAVVKSLAISKFVHLFLSLPNPPEHIVKELNSLCFKFIWNDKPDKIKRINIVKDYKHGGLGTANLQKFIDALKISWLRRMLKHDRKWQHSFYNAVGNRSSFWQ